MHKKFGPLVCISIAIVLFSALSAVGETLYYEDFSSPGTLTELGFTNVFNWTKNDVDEYSVAGVGGDIFFTISDLHKPIVLDRESSNPLGIEWKMNLQNTSPLSAGNLIHIVTLCDDDRPSATRYHIEFSSAEDSGGPYISVYIKKIVEGVETFLGSDSVDAPWPGFTWITMRVELAPSLAAGGDESISIQMDLGDGSGLVERLSVTDSSISALTRISFLYQMIPSTPIYFDDLKFTTGEEPIQTGTVTYQYDPLGRLRNASFDDGATVSDVGFDYDATGNRTQKGITQY